MDFENKRESQSKRLELMTFFSIIQLTSSTVIFVIHSSMISGGSPWYTALRNLDFNAFVKALERESLSIATMPYASANVLAKSPLYDDAVARLPMALVNEMTIPAWYVFFMLTEQVRDPTHASQRATFRREAQKYFQSQGVNVGDWWDIMQKALRLIQSA